MTAILPMSPFSRMACAAPGAPWLPKHRNAFTLGWPVTMSSAVCRARFWSSEAGKRVPTGFSLEYFFSASLMAASAQMLCAGTVSEPTKTAYSPSAFPMAFTMASIAASPKALLSIISTS